MNLKFQESIWQRGQHLGIDYQDCAIKQKKSINKMKVTNKLLNKCNCPTTSLYEFFLIDVSTPKMFFFFQ
jgi:hypothetical protein